MARRALPEKREKLEPMALQACLASRARMVRSDLLVILAKLARTASPVFLAILVPSASLVTLVSLVIMASPEQMANRESRARTA
jgi:hypothetical protein